MSKYFVRFTFLSTFFCVVFLTLSNPKVALAARTVNSTTLNGASSVTVTPGATITANVTVTTSGGGSANDWNSTSWNISGVNCVDHANFTNSGTNNVSFSITAPSTPGTYSVSFIGYQNDTCTQNPSNTLTMSNSIAVVAPTPSPSPSPTNTPTPTATITATITVTATPSPTNIPGVSNTSTPTLVPGISATPTTISTGSSSSSSTGTLYYPTLSLAKTGKQFVGSATVDQGTITSVEYSLDNGQNWNNAQPDDGNFNGKEEKYNFTLTKYFAVGSHTIFSRAKSLANVYTKESDYAKLTFTVEAPIVTIHKFQENPTNNISPTITGKATSAQNIDKVEISANGGETWDLTTLNSGTFSKIFENLEDGNYDFIARATDAYGNTGTSDILTLVVDTIPPIIGGNTISSGVLSLNPYVSGTIVSVVGTEIDFSVSLRGGVTEGYIQSGDLKFPLIKKPGTHIWVANLFYEKVTNETLKIEVKDGADNVVSRDLNRIVVKAPGIVSVRGSGEIINESSVALYYYDSISKKWVLWDGQSFAQDNPQKTSSGSYSFIAPPGKYYLEVKSDGYKTVRSQIFERGDNTIINSNFSLTPNKYISVNFPFFGSIKITIPDLSPIETEQINFDDAFTSTTDTRIGTNLPKINMPLGNTEVFQLQNKTALISFVSSWSKNSRDQIPILSEFNKNNGTKDLLVVFLQDSPSFVDVYMKRGKYNFRYFADKNGDVFNEFEVNSLPQHYFVNSKGEINKIVTGLLSESQLLEQMSKLN